MTAKILVVDDIPSNVKLLEIKLKNEYYSTICCYNSLEVLDIAKSQQPDIILLDIMMPGMDGFAVCDLLKKDYDTMHIPVIVVTALADMESKVHALSSGADEFLIKPINDVQLFSRIKSLLRLKIIIDELKLRYSTNIDMGDSYRKEIMEYANTVSDATILIVDEDIVQSSQMRSKLKNYFTNVVSLNDMSKSDNYIRSENCDVIIIDIQISGNSGLQFCSQLRSQFSTRFIPILILIDEDSIDTAAKAMELGINDYLTFPINDNEMVARITTQVKRKRYQDALRESMQTSIKMSITDPLTGLYNRRYFDSYMYNLLISSTNCKNFSLMMIDIDHFKDTNDTYGHFTADKLLIEMSNRFKYNLRISDLISRFGGEEFVVVLPDTRIEGAYHVAERIRTSINDELFLIDGHQIHKTISIGLTTCAATDVLTQVLKRADEALYDAKNSGRNVIKHK